MIAISWTFLLAFVICELICAHTRTATLIDKCPRYQRVSALEGEHARLRCRFCNGGTPMDNNDLQTYGLNITWFKDTSEHGPMELRLGEKRRITSEGTLLEFWPVMVNDTGKYSCHLL
uniref:Ig-like domain-containing protein n=1 Tax=Callorhinchus milii TaxID=7868 RepID=A0A4W3JQ61_CALMI